MFAEWTSTKQANIYLLSKPLNFIGCHGNQRAEFAKNIQKLNPQKGEEWGGRWGVKLKLCRNVHRISLYKNIVFLAVAYRLWLLWQLKSCHRLIMGNKKKLALIAVLLQVF